MAYVLTMALSAERPFLALLSGEATLSASKFSCSDPSWPFSCCSSPRASQHGPQVKLDDVCHTAAHSCPTQQLGLSSRIESGGSWGCLTEDQCWSPRGECGLVGGCSLGGWRCRWLSRWLKLREHKARGTDEAGKVPACSASFLPACSSFHMRNSGPDHPERLYSNQRTRGIYGVTSG